MKKIILSVAVVATAAIAGWNYQQNQQSVELSDLALENVEALARSEDGKTYKYVFPGSDPTVQCVCSGSGSLACCYK